MRNLHRFVQLVGENKEIAEKMQEISFDDPKAIIAYAKDLGFEFDEKIWRIRRQYAGKVR